MKGMEFPNDLSISDVFCLATAITVKNADISDIADNEIRCLNPENQNCPLSEIKNWHGKLIKKEPIQGDLGINNKREIFHFRNGLWKSIK